MITRHPNSQRDKTRLFNALLILGFALIATGIIITLTATILSNTSASTSTGVIIFIGPIPIAFGAGPNAIFTLMLAAIFTALMLLAFLIMRRRTQKPD